MNNKTLDLRRLDLLPIDEITNGFEVRWNNTLLLTTYRNDQTLVVTTQGRCLVLKRSLKQVLDQFAESVGIHYFEMRALYQMIGERTQGYVAGNYQLVPTCGRTNARVVYYMNHHLDNFVLDDDGAILATFMTDHQTYQRVLIDTNWQTFRRLQSAAQQVSKMHLESFENLCRHYGVKRRSVQGMTSQTSPLILKQRRAHHEQVLFQMLNQVVTESALTVYGENFAPHFYSHLKTSFHRV